MKEYQKALQCKNEFFSAWIGEVPAEISALFAEILTKAEQENIFDINKPTKHGSSLLHLIIMSASLDQTKAMRILLSHGADINLSEAGDRTPLHWAVTRFSMDTSRFNFVNFLIANGADVNKGDKEGMTPLRYAIQLIDYSGVSHSRSLLPILLKNGAQVSRQDKDGINPYDELEQKIEDHLNVPEIEKLHDSMEVLKAYFDEEKKLATERAVEFKNTIKEKWQSQAKPYGHHLKNIISEAKDEGIFDVNWSGKMGYNLLHLAAIYEEVEVMKFLLNQGADVNRQTTTKYNDKRIGYTALHCILNSNGYISLDMWNQHSFSTNQQQGILLLLKYDAKIDILDKDGCTILKTAIANQKYDNGFLLDLLVEGQRDPYKKQQLAALKTGIYQMPSLVNISIFAIQKTFPKSTLENMKDKLPEVIYSRLVN
jgi:ankyrin repeat protein